jgi:ABC-type transporter Mla subunit MlaD
MANPLKRLSRIRTVIFVFLVLFAIAGVVLHLGVVSFLFRGILLLGVVALFASYLWGFYLKWRKTN